MIRIDDQNFGHQRAQDVASVIEQSLHALEVVPDRLQTVAGGSGSCEIRVGLGSCCVAQGSGQVHDALSQVIASTGARAAVKGVGCIGMCHQTPLVEVVKPNGKSTFYSQARPEQARQIVLRHFQPRGVFRRLG